SSILRTQSDTPACRAFSELSQNDIGTGESALPHAAAASALLDGPLEACFHRRAVDVEIGAVETQPGFEAQAVTRTEPDRRELRVLEYRPGERLRRAGRNADLEAILPRVARARHDAIRAEDRRRAHIHELHGRDVGA